MIYKYNVSKQKGTPRLNIQAKSMMVWLKILITVWTFFIKVKVM